MTESTTANRDSIEYGVLWQVWLDKQSSYHNVEMDKHKYIKAVFSWALCFGLAACSNHAVDNSKTNKTIADIASTPTQQTVISPTDSLAVQIDVLTKIYTQAIAEFIKAAHQKDKTTFDTLFFGKHVYGQPDDFPDIQLPEIIERTQVRLITPEAGLKKQQARKSLVYINMMGWIGQEKAEFMVVVFSNGAEHQYDYFINFTYNNTRKEFELVQIQFENYLHSKAEKPKRLTIYKDGKYVGG